MIGGRFPGPFKESFRELFRGAIRGAFRAARLRVGFIAIAAVVAPMLVIVGCGSHVAHVVRKGDTLYSVSFRYDQDYRDLARWNGIEPPYVLTPGQRLRVAPPRAPSHAERMTAALRAPAPAGQAPASARPAPQPDQRAARNGEPATAPAKSTPPAASARAAPRSTPASIASPAPASAPAWRWPVADAAVRADASVSRVSKGLDIVARRGEPVHAAAGGRVVYAGAGIPHYGNLLIVKHDERFLTAYAHNDRLLVSEGDMVNAGQVIAEMGDSGTGTQTVKLHFEIRLDGEPVDPMTYLGGA